MFGSTCVRGWPRCTRRHESAAMPPKSSRVMEMGSPLASACETEKSASFIADLVVLTKYALTARKRTKKIHAATASDLDVMSGGAAIGVAL